MIGGIRTCLGVSDDPIFLRISSNSCPVNLLLARSHQAEIIIVKRLILRRNNVTRVQVECRPFDQDRRKHDAFTHSAMLPACSRDGAAANEIADRSLLPSQVEPTTTKIDIHSFSARRSALRDSVKPSS